MDKSGLRIQYLKKRTSLSYEQRSIKSKQIHDLLFSRLMMHRYDTIHCYLPIEKKAEVDTTLILKTLLKDFSPSLYAPKMSVKGKMTHHRFENFTDFKENKWGVLEPTGPKGLSHKTFFETDDDILVIVPLLAFDKKGFRVGYGGGYYDRFLAHKTENTTTVGLSFFEAEEEPIETEFTDVPLKYCVTRERIWSF